MRQRLRLDDIAAAEYVEFNFRFGPRATHGKAIAIAQLEEIEILWRDLFTIGIDNFILTEIGEAGDLDRAESFRRILPIRTQDIGNLLAASRTLVLDVNILLLIVPVLQVRHIKDTREVPLLGL